jgi:hypothetical protein
MLSSSGAGSEGGLGDLRLKADGVQRGLRLMAERGRDATPKMMLPAHVESADGVRDVTWGPSVMGESKVTPLPLSV